MKINKKTKSDNNKHTQECRKIFDDLKFARIETERLITNRKVMLFAGLIIFFLAILGLIIMNRVNNDDDSFGTIVFYVFCIGIVVLFIGGSIFGLIYYSRENKEDRGSARVYYYINDGTNKFKVVVKEEDDGKIYVKALINFNKNKILYMGNEGAEMYIDEYGNDALMDFTGFYQYTTSNEYKVLRHSHLMTKKIYKFKKLIGNKTLYYFKDLARAKGERYPRSISLIDGILEKVCVQESYNSGFSKDRHTQSNITTTRMKYAFVNDLNCKLYLHKQAYLDAQKLKFQLPKLENILISE